MYFKRVFDYCPTVGYRNLKRNKELIFKTLSRQGIIKNELQIGKVGQNRVLFTFSQFLFL